MWKTLNVRLKYCHFAFNFQLLTSFFFRCIIKLPLDVILYLNYLKKTRVSTSYTSSLKSDFPTRVLRRKSLAKRNLWYSRFWSWTSSFRYLKFDVCTCKLISVLEIDACIWNATWRIYLKCKWKIARGPFCTWKETLVLETQFHACDETSELGTKFCTWWDTSLLDTHFCTCGKTSVVKYDSEENNLSIPWSKLQSDSLLKSIVLF